MAQIRQNSNVCIKIKNSRCTSIIKTCCQLLTYRVTGVGTIVFHSSTFVKWITASRTTSIDGYNEKRPLKFCGAVLDAVLLRRGLFSLAIIRLPSYCGLRPSADRCSDSLFTTTRNIVHTVWSIHLQIVKLSNMHIKYLQLYIQLSHLLIISLIQITKPSSRSIQIREL